MTKLFRQTITELWQIAGLSAPRFAPDGSITLEFDDVGLVMTLSADEQSIVVIADLGVLPPAFLTNPDRLQTILAMSFAFLATHDVLVSLTNDRLGVSGSYSFSTQDIRVLSDILSDVVSAVQTLLAQISHTRITLRQSGGPTETDHNAMIIFQP